MLLEQSALCNMAAELELKAIEECKFHPYFMTELDTFFLDVYFNLRPTASDYEQRRQLVQEFNMIVKSSFGNIEGFPVVEAFGSFIMDIFTANSDLDLSINFNNSNALHFPRNRAVHVLRSLTKDLYRKQRKGQLSGVLPILRARVPVLKAVDCKTGIECDISVENKDGISRSLFFSIISSIDERFHILSYLMKAWAKANDINSSKDSTMNSLSIIALVAFHFQTRNPPILPPFSAYLRDGSDITNLKKVVLEFKNFGCKNKESVAELFVALLIKLSSVEKLWELGLCASTFGGSWVSCTSKVGNMNVEDFFNRSENFARSVGKCQLTKICDCIHESLKNLSRTMLGLIKFYNLRSVLFGSTPFDTRNDLVKGKSSTTIKKKPTGKIQHKQKACNQSVTTTNQVGGNTCLDKKQRLSLNKPADPKNPIQKEKSSSKTVTPTNRASNNKALVLKRKVSSNEPAEPRTQKARRVAPALPSIHLPAPITYPAVPSIPFVLPGHPFHGDPMRPVFANMVYGYQPQHHMIYHPMAHPYASNPTTHPSLILGCPTYVAGHPHIPFPPFSSFGSNRL